MFVSRIVVVILWGLFWVRPVFAGPIYVQEANSITAVFFTQINLNNGLNTIKTTSLTANSDTVLYLWDPVNNVEISHNDDSQAGLASEIQVNISNTNNPTGKYWIIVHAYSSQSSGNCDVEVAGATNATFVNVYFGGRKLYVYADSQSTTGNNYHIETSLRPAPSGMVDPMMFGIQCDGEMVAYNDDGGVGKNSRISSNKVCYVLVSPYTDPYTRTLVGNEGDVRLYVNDALQHVNSDSDNDGLGEKLEQALGTCDKRTQSTPAYSCSSSNVYNLQDTDHDGLSDYQEVFGIDDPSNPQYLPRWGADPLKKDVFIEVDYFSPGNENTLGADALRKVQYYFDAGMSQSVRNPNGENGVQLHFDVGREPSENSPASDFILYGDWGGGD